MDPNFADLLKAARNIQAHHFKKAAAHHDTLASQHDKCMMAHKAHTEQHEELMGKAKEAGLGHLQEFHKCSMSFHKTKTAMHDRLTKAHAAHADHLRKMSDACAAETAEKVYKILGIEVPENMEKADETKTNQPDQQPQPPSPDLAKTLTDAIMEGLKQGFAELSKTLAEQLKPVTPPAPPAPAPTAPEPEPVVKIRTFAVPRAGDEINLDDVDPEFASLCKLEG